MSLIHVISIALCPEDTDFYPAKEQCAQLRGATRSVVRWALPLLRMYFLILEIFGKKQLTKYNQE